eukprot:981270-Rhodomonas_salina.1
MGGFEVLDEDREALLVAAVLLCEVHRVLAACTPAGQCVHTRGSRVCTPVAQECAHACTLSVSRTDTQE